MNQVLVLPRHDTQSASCRHRFLQYLPYLAEQGLDCAIEPFFDAEYTHAVLTEGHKQWWRWGQYAARRVGKLLQAARYDLVVVHAEIVPYLPPFFERWLSRRAAPYVLDFDDAFFHQYDQHALGVVRRTLGLKIGNLMRGAAMNTAGNSYLADYTRRFSNHVAIVPTVVDLSRYPDSPQRITDDVFRIGWIGSAATTPHLRSVVAELAGFCRNHRAEVIAIGAKPFPEDGVPIRFVPWTEATEVEHLARIDVGIMPLPSTAFASGKCGFKLIQTMACWRPVIASPVGVNCQIVQDGVNGLFAGPGQWCNALERLYNDTEFRRDAGLAARRHVEQNYSLNVWGPRVAELWSGLAARS